MGTLTALFPGSVLRTAFDLCRIHQAIGLTSLGLTTISVVTGIMDEQSYGKYAVT